MAHNDRPPAWRQKDSSYQRVLSAGNPRGGAMSPQQTSNGSGRRMCLKEFSSPVVKQDNTTLSGADSTNTPPTASSPLSPVTPCEAIKSPFVLGTGMSEQPTPSHEFGAPNQLETPSPSESSQFGAGSSRMSEEQPIPSHANDAQKSPQTAGPELDAQQQAELFRQMFNIQLQPAAALEQATAMLQAALEGQPPDVQQAILWQQMMALREALPGLFEPQPMASYPPLWRYPLGPRSPSDQPSPDVGPSSGPSQRPMTFREAVLRQETSSDPSNGDSSKPRFQRIKANVLGPGIAEIEWYSQLRGCHCEGECSAEQRCACLIAFADNYSPERRLTAQTDWQPILECHDDCSCALNPNPCRNRCAQFPISVGLEVKNVEDKGRGVFATQDIAENTFVCEYIGEVIGPTEVERRAKLGYKNNYTLSIKERSKDWEVKTFIDPRFRGNIARWINHSCDPNLKPVIFRAGAPIPRAGLFSSRAIKSGEELCYDYGESRCKPSNPKACNCKAPNCRSFLPMSSTATE